MPAIAAERCIRDRELTEPRLGPGGRVLGYVSSVAGAATLVVEHLDTGVTVHLATAPPVRPGRGLGGGAWTFLPAGDSVVYVATDGNLWRQALDGAAAVRLTGHGPERTATGPHATPDGSGVVYALDLAEVHRLDLACGRSTRLDDGRADFVMDPFVDPGSSSVRWHAWNVPDMPWDASRVQVWAGGEVRDEAVSPCSVQQPRRLPDGRSICIRDDHGWANLWVGDAPLVPEPTEHAGPSWGPGQCSYAWSPDGRRVAFTRNERGFGRLCVVDVESGVVEQIARGVHGRLSWEGSRLAALRTGACTPTQVVVYDTGDWQRRVVATLPGHWGPGELTEPEPVEIPSGDGATLHARLYCTPAADGRMIVWLHGGPTDQWQVTFMPRLAFWMSRGWSVLVPDHRGSTGHGRAYQQALRGRWGELDVADTLAATADVQASGWADPSRTVLMGSSAGGFTAIGAIASAADRFAAAVLLYPVSDLVELAETSHRFERHSTHHLVGPLPEALDRHRSRSPIFHAARVACTPMLLLHGDNDWVVPVRQSEVFAERVRTAGGDVTLHVYPGEGHGFREPANQLDEYRRTEDFLACCVPIASRA